MSNIAIRRRKLRTPKGVKLDPKRDKQRKALHPGKRVSKSGKTYYETRCNRADADRRSKK